MKAVSRSLHEQKRFRAEALVGAGMLALFKRFPYLTGFSIRGRSPSLEERTSVGPELQLDVVDVVVQTWPGWGPGDGLHDGIASAIEQIIDEWPDATELLRDRTFARAWH